MKEKLLIIICLLLTGCPFEPDIPKEATCTADGWRVDIQTGDIITNDSGSAIKCTFS